MLKHAFILNFLSLGRASIPGPAAYEAAALPTELPRHKVKKKLFL